MKTILLKTGEQCFVDDEDFAGVYWHSAAGKWAAQLHVTIGGKSRPKHLGLHEQEDDAARAYNHAAVEHFGKEFALLNPV